MNGNDSPLGKPHFAGCVCVACELGKEEAMAERTVEQMCRDLLSIAVADGLVTFNSDRFHSASNASELTSGDLAGMANGLANIIAEFRRDAERWRKVRSMNWNDGKLTVTNSGSVKLGHDTFSGDRLDAAVDALP